MSADLDVLHRRALESRLSDGALDAVFRYLGARRQAETPADWLRWVESVALHHPIRDLFHSDPFTARAYTRPRGYPADPITLDHVFGALVPQLSHHHPAPGFLVHPVHRYVTMRRPSSHAIADRCRFLAAEIDRTASAHPSCRVLAVAAGRLREAELSEAIRRGEVGELVATDYDPEVVSEVAAATAGLAVTSLQASVRDLLGWRLRLGTFDLIYTASLIDHLADRTAMPLLDCLTQLLRPGGRLLAANFVADHADQGYMESFMGWRMACRHPRALQRLAGELLPGRYTAATTLAPQASIAWLEITRSA